ncbi:MAG TPA: tetratricopeptide repeat protein, partial [Candidatus Sulfotelmatobacter sp.]|nr:tetratricopeptide repeat protein [Candidatus Sulfotelmatobacter sp.]
DQAPVFQNWSSCELYAELAGFRSDRLRLTDRPDMGSTNVGTITLHQVNVSADDPRFTVSVNSLAAPDKARKAFDKGEEAERKGKWEQACDYFKRAVEVYPRYSIAWLELGRLQLRQNSLLDAQQSFRHAVDEDSKLVDGYVELARVAAAQQNWQALAVASDTLIQRWPDSSPEYWFFDSLAYYNLGNLDPAETSVTRGLRLDSRHQLPQLEYLCGLILGAKKDYKAGAEHIDNYLHLAPNSPIADIAKKALAAYQQRVRLEADDQR